MKSKCFYTEPVGLEPRYPQLAVALQLHHQVTGQNAGNLWPFCVASNTELQDVTLAFYPALPAFLSRSLTSASLPSKVPQ